MYTWHKIGNECKFVARAFGIVKWMDGDPWEERGHISPDDWRCVAWNNSLSCIIKKGSYHVLVVGDDQSDGLTSRICIRVFVQSLRRPIVENLYRIEALWTVYQRPPATSQKTSDIRVPSYLVHKRVWTCKIQIVIGANPYALHAMFWWCMRFAAAQPVISQRNVYFFQNNINWDCCPSHRFSRLRSTIEPPCPVRVSWCRTPSIPSMLRQIRAHGLRN